jgi:DNA-binding beta-propeller fold protein YncE
MDNVWIGGNGGGDSHVLKFTRSGEFLLQVGEPGNGVNSMAENHFSRVAKVTYDGPANEIYLADGYGNKRVAVIDAGNGDLKRFWGAYGTTTISDDFLGAYDPMAEPAQQFRGPVHCADPADDDFVYVCDRGGNRIQVFTKTGDYVEEIFIEKNSGGSGAVWDVAFSPDPAQSFIYVADGLNERVHVVRRQGMEYIYNFGDGGRMAGQFFGTHSIATDSQGNIYTTETYEGKRLQKHTYMGMGPAPSGSTGVAHPE